ncbi:hypothetical protein [Zavarzinia aquatilis]|uniref:Uncharacterized protein n=1 Tax=Zavarzinia aquatilis TaxID=2211142 RepID=A0A317EG25_9PROT|nr:hypothetical protein [Zavarzinia aquatilis]PWR24145.1 hypothetical protein DKG74_08460 [Zavarzinia aquatilis]
MMEPSDAGAGALPELFTSIATAEIDVAFDRIDLTDWVFGLSSAEYEMCSADHIACASTTAPDGRRLSINVEAIGGDVLIQRYVEDVSSPSLCRLRSTSDLLHRLGPATIGIVWEFSVEALAGNRCRFTNRIVGSATPELLDLFERNAVPLSAAAAQMQSLTDVHNAGETPWFARNIAAKARGAAGEGRPVPPLDLDAPLIGVSRCTAPVDVAIDDIDLSAWLFSLTDADYRACSVAHIAAGGNVMADGRRFSLNVERPRSLLVQKYQEVESGRTLCRVVSPRSDMFTPQGRSSLHVTWELRLAPTGPDSCALTNLVELRSTPEFEAGLAAAGLSMETVKPPLLAALSAHNAEETPNFAADLSMKVRPQCRGSS